MFQGCSTAASDPAAEELQRPRVGGLQLRLAATAKFMRLVGGNGAGKSTFARILSGLTVRDAGDIHLEGRPYTPISKREAERAGVIMVLQELNVIGTMSIAENIFLNRLPRHGGFLRFAALHEKARKALARVGLDAVDPATPAGFLGVGQQQLVEVAGALSQNCRLLILDEPTAALTDPEIEQLFGNIRRLQKEGVGVHLRQPPDG
jgi:ribose transport system ATP-binding protein